MNFLNFCKRTLGAVLKLIFRGERPQNGTDAMKVSSDGSLEGGATSIAESAGYGVLSCGEKNSSVRCQYMNFLRPRKRTSETMLHTLRALLPQNASYAQQPDDDVYKKGTRRGRIQAEGALSGRSMTEMLGVLAIIGVLSVGAIAGYQKAMFKYKLNKQSEQMNSIIYAIISNAGKWHSSGGSIIPTLIQLGDVPNEMIKGNQIYDVFDMEVTINKGSGNVAYKDYIYLGTSFTGYNDNNHALCVNLLQTAKAFTDDILAVGVNATTADDINQQDWYYGTHFCSEYNNQIKRCLQHLNTDAMYRLCNICDAHSCGVFVTFMFDKF